MAGNTRGKLKEHFEGVHRNFDWSLYHINTSLALLALQVAESQRRLNPQITDAAIQEIVEKHPLYIGIKSLGEGIQTLDNLAQQVYSKL